MRCVMKIKMLKTEKCYFVGDDYRSIKSVMMLFQSHEKFYFDFSVINVVYNSDF